MDDSFGDRMKAYEMAEAGRMLMPLLPCIARIDGRSFSTFTKAMDRPYDKRLSDLMVATTTFLVQETNACTGYTQSDEITLAWYSETFDHQVFFNGRIQKMTSQLAALASAFFNMNFKTFFPNGHSSTLATFDARVWNVPNLMEGSNCFLWREQDATKNSISMATRAYYDHKAMMNKNGGEMQEMLFRKGVNWNDYPAFFKRGTYVQRKIVSRKFTTEELESLPEKHQARKNPDLVVERSEYKTLDMPPFGTVTNRPGVIFYGEEPQTATKGTVLRFAPEQITHIEIGDDRKSF